MKVGLRVLALLVVLLVPIAWTSGARAQEEHGEHEHDDEQHERQHQTMKAVSRNFGAAYDALDIYKNFWARVQTRLDTLEQMVVQIPTFELKQNQDRRDEFEDFARQFAERVQELETAAEEKDLETLDAKVRETGMLCSRCHKVFRPKKK